MYKKSNNSERTKKWLRFFFGEKWQVMISNVSLNEQIVSMYKLQINKLFLPSEDWS